MKEKFSNKDEGSAEMIVERNKNWLFLRTTPQFMNMFEAPTILKRIKPYVRAGQIIADIGCGWGYFTFLLADLVGPQGRIYSVDLSEKCIQSIKKKAERLKYKNILGISTTAADLDQIEDNSVDLIFANGLLCSMEKGRFRAVKEMIRILKPDGFAYISLGAAPPFGLVDEPEWNEILSIFRIHEGGSFKEKWVMAGP